MCSSNLKCCKVDGLVSEGSEEERCSFDEHFVEEV